MADELDGRALVSECTGKSNPFRREHRQYIPVSIEIPRTFTSRAIPPGEPSWGLRGDSRAHLPVGGASGKDGPEIPRVFAPARRNHDVRHNRHEEMTVGRDRNSRRLLSGAENLRRQLSWQVLARGEGRWKMKVEFDTARTYVSGNDQAAGSGSTRPEFLSAPVEPPGPVLPKLLPLLRKTRPNHYESRAIKMDYVVEIQGTA